ncbi:MAG: phosphoenolpyruvate synthase [Thermoprotei archaeon]|nr:phosphoenolpyruvate synthase [TACK group archaeon]
MADKKEALLLWFDELGREDVSIVGGKSANLGEMTRELQKAGVPVPYGFSTTAKAYRYFLEYNHLNEKIDQVMAELKDPNDTDTLQKVGATIRSLIVNAQLPPDLASQVTEAYKKLSQMSGADEAYVAVRSSATAEDLPDASFAGQQETYLNVKGEQEVLQKLKECYASLFTDRAIFYRAQKGFSQSAVSLAAAIQLMVFSKASGVMFTLDVSNGDTSVVLIEASYGLGEYVVQGTVTPDEYYVRKTDLEIIKKNINKKTKQLVRLPNGGTVEQEVPAELQDKPALTDDQIKTLASYGIAIEKHYGRPMDTEWALDERTNKLFIVQARPETVWSAKGAAKEQAAAEQKVSATAERKVLVSGLPASPGLAAGKAHVILDVKHIDEFQDGEILVTEMTAPDWVPAMKKAKAIVTNSGGMTCHAAIVSRELGIPCIVGTASRGAAATEALKTGQDITVDATNGVVYEGILEEATKQAPAATAAEGGAVVTAVESYPITGTKIYVNLGEPDLADKVSKLPADGVGLMREEFIWASYIGEHPLYLIKVGHPEKVVNGLAEGFRKVAQAFNPRPVVLRFSDFKTSEYRDLKGGEEFEPQEPSPLLGWRGASRYYDPKYIEGFKLEVQAVKKVREEYGLKNLWVMIPFTRTVDELRKVVEIMDEQGLRRGPDFKVWLMAEIPSNIILADKFAQYVDGFSVGSNDLTMLILGTDRDNGTVGHIFDERNLAVLRAVKQLIKVAHHYGKTVSVCGQAPSVYPEFTKFLVEQGIDSVSVNPDAVISTRKNVAAYEQRILLDGITKKGMVEDPDLRWDPFPE